MSENKKQYAYADSEDSEHYTGGCDSIENAIECGIDMCDGDPDKTVVWVGEVVKYKASKYFNIDSIVENACDDAYDNDFHYVESDIIELKNGIKFDEFKKEFIDTIDKYYEISHFSVINTKSYPINKK